MAGCAVLSNFRRLFEELRPARRWFLAGCVVTLLSLFAQLALIHHAAPSSSGTFSTREIAAFITFWDGHRKPVAITNTGVSLNFAALAITSFWLFVFSDDLPRPSIFLLRFTMVSAIVSIALIFVSWIPPDRLPATLLILMPGRVLNFCALIYTAMIVGLLG